MPGFFRLPRVSTGALLLTALLFSLYSGQAKPAAAITKCDVADLTVDQEESAFLRTINDYRAQFGLGALTVSENLNRSASWMATDMATRNYFSHTDSTGRYVFARIADCGGSPSSGENLGAGPQIISAAQAFELWRTSPSHNSNMLEGAYRQIGISRVSNPGSHYTYYWATTFHTIDDGTRAGAGGGGGAPAPTAVAPAQNLAAAAPSAPAPAPGNSGIVQGATSELYAPAPGHVIASPASVFSWTTVPGAVEYWLDVGSCWGCNDIYGSSTGMVPGTIVLNLPQDGRNIYARVSVRTARGWSYEDFPYQVANTP
jgi:uncharacterized protein YkwD